MSDFAGDDYEFAAGSIKGIRSWSIDALGRLHGVTHKEVWTPGDNVATCKATRSIGCPEFGKRSAKKKIREEVQKPPSGYEFRLYGDGLIEAPSPCGEPTCDGVSHSVPTEHSFDPECRCGFWAYDEASYKRHGDVTGVIEAFGKTTIGTRGFRAEKARIVALARDNGEHELSLSEWLRLQQLYPAAGFFDDLETMVTKHGGVLKKWEPVGDDFWTKTLPPTEDAFSAGGIFKSAIANSSWAIPPSSFKFFRA